MFSALKKSATTSQTQSAQVNTAQSNFEEKWSILQVQGINQLLDFIAHKNGRPFTDAEYMHVYSTAYNVCTQKVNTGKPNQTATELLYERYASAIRDYLLARVVPSLAEKESETLLLEAVRRWRDHLLIVKWMTKLFAYLDRYYTKHNNRDTLRDVGLKVYQSLVYGSIKNNMARALLDKIYIEREGELIDRSMMKDGIQLFIEMGLNSLSAYEKDFEAALITETAQYYSRESSKWISQDSCPDYMRKAENRLKEEQLRCQAYLHNSTETSLIKVVESKLIADHQKKLLEMEGSGFLKLLEAMQVDDLSRMYRLFKRVNGLKPMAEAMRTFVTQEGMSILNTHQGKEELDCTAYIEALLETHEKYSKLVNIQFEKDSLFLEAMKDAFTTFVNTDLQNPKKKAKSSTAELLSTYCDTIMKTTDKIGEENIDELLEKIVRLFGYISDKDMFQEFYRRQLSKRLLVAKTNDDTERLLISKLKMRCGAAFTAKLEGMIKDKNLSEDMQRNFREYVDGKGIKLSIPDFSPQVLTTGFWPAFKVDQLTVPQEMDHCMTVFKQYYDSRTQSRLLRWVHSLGTATVLGRYENGDKDLLVSTYQACILLLFNQTPELSAGDIQKSLSLPFDDVKKNLLSMGLKIKIVKKANADAKEVLKDITATDVFTVNADFKAPTRRIRIPNIVMKVSGKERDEIGENVQEDRKHAIEAAIVRVMKARRQMEHQQLVLEASKQLMAHFKPDPKVIKRRIEDLITREYLERDEKKPSVYNYLA